MISSNEGNFLWTTGKGKHSTTIYDHQGAVIGSQLGSDACPVVIAHNADISALTAMNANVLRALLPTKPEGWQAGFGVERSEKAPEILKLRIAGQECQLYENEFAFLLRAMLTQAGDDQQPQATPAAPLAQAAPEQCELPLLYVRADDADGNNWDLLMRANPATDDVQAMWREHYGMDAADPTTPKWIREVPLVNVRGPIPWEKINPTDDE